MKLCSFALRTPLGTALRVGVMHGDSIVDATAARVALLERMLPTDAADRVGTAQVPPDMAALIGSGPQALEWAREAVDAAVRHGQEETSRGAALLHRPSAVQLLAPVPRPPGIACFVTLVKGVEPNEDLKKELRDHVAKEIGTLARPDAIRFTESLPKTRSGKIMRRLLRDIAGGRQTTGDTTTLEDYTVLAKLREEEEG